MPTLSVGATNRQRGITLIEMLLVVAIVALIAGMSAPSVSAGLDTLRLRSSSDAIVGFLNTALSRAETRQQAVEILISPRDGKLTAMSSDGAFHRQLDIASPMRILSVKPEVPGDDQTETRRFLLYPGGAVPKIAIELGNGSGRTRVVSVDPITGVPEAHAK